MAQSQACWGWKFLGKLNYAQRFGCQTMDLSQLLSKFAGSKFRNFINKISSAFTTAIQVRSRRDAITGQYTIFCRASKATSAWLSHVITHNSSVTSVMCSDTLLPILSLERWHVVLPKREQEETMSRRRTKESNELSGKRKVLYLTDVLSLFPSHIPLERGRLWDHTTCTLYYIVHCIKKCERKSTHADEIIQCVTSMC